MNNIEINNNNIGKNEVINNKQNIYNPIDILPPGK